jgi:hypothetical protein
VPEGSLFLLLQEMTMTGYRVLQRPVFTAIQAMTHEEFAELQKTCEFNRNFPGWKRLGRKLIEVKRVRAHLVAKPA